MVRCRCRGAGSREDVDDDRCLSLGRRCDEEEEEEAAATASLPACAIFALSSRWNGPAGTRDVNCCPAMFTWFKIPDAFRPALSNAAVVDLPALSSADVASWVVVVRA